MNRRIQWIEKMKLKSSVRRVIKGREEYPLTCERTLERIWLYLKRSGDRLGSSIIGFDDRVGYGA